MPQYWQKEVIHKGYHFGNLVWRAIVCRNFASVEDKSYDSTRYTKITSIFMVGDPNNMSVYSSPGVYRARLMRQSYHLPQINRPPSFKMSSISTLSRSNM